MVALLPSTADLYDSDNHNPQRQPTTWHYVDLFHLFMENFGLYRDALCGVEPHKWSQGVVDH